jgi:hypothetical protein
MIHCVLCDRIPEFEQFGHHKCPCKALWCFEDAGSGAWQWTFWSGGGTPTRGGSLSCHVEPGADLEYGVTVGGEQRHHPGLMDLRQLESVVGSVLSGPIVREARLEATVRVVVES